MVIVTVTYKDLKGIFKKKIRNVALKRATPNDIRLMKNLSNNGYSDLIVIRANTI